MALSRGLGAFDDGTALVPGVGTTPLDVRKSLGAIFSLTGVMPGGPSPLVTGTSGWAYSVDGRAYFVTSRGASDGYQFYANDGPAVIGTTGIGSTVPVAPGAGLQRIDIAWTRHPTNTENGDSSSAPIFGVASGLAASTALPPTIPAGALEIGRNLMLSTATSTASTGNTISQTAPVATLRGVTATTAAVVTQSTATLGPNFTVDTAIITAPAVTGDGVKRFKITGKSSLTQFSVSGDLFDYKLKCDTTVIAAYRVIVASTSYQSTPPLTVSHVPTSGSHVYSMWLVRAAGTGTATITPSGLAGDVNEIIVEQIA